MPGFTLGEKTTSSQIFNDKGDRIPVTFIRTAQCYLVDIKAQDKDGYFAVKLGFGKTKNIKKTVMGVLTKAGIKTPLRFLREIRLDKFKDLIKVVEDGKKIGLEFNGTKIYIGDEIKPTVFFKNGDMLNVSSTSKGKGFQGVVKRHGFAGGPRTHGQSDRERGPGSIGQTTTPGRVYKGKRMAGRMGNSRATVKNLEVIKVQEDGILVKGLIPGARGGLIEVRSAI